jgi:hypothetical protein
MFPEKVQSPDSYRAEIEKTRRVKLDEIKARTEEELRKLKLKYAVQDRVGTSLTILASVTIVLFISIIGLNDLIRLIKFLKNKSARQSPKPLKTRNAKSKKKKKSHGKVTVTQKKLKNVDIRTYKRNVGLKRPLN